VEFRSSGPSFQQKLTPPFFLDDPPFFFVIALNRLESLHKEYSSPRPCRVSGNVSTALPSHKPLNTSRSFRRLSCRPPPLPPIQPHLTASTSLPGFDVPLCSLCISGTILAATPRLRRLSTLLTQYDMTAACPRPRCLFPNLFFMNHNDVSRIFTLLSRSFL